MAETSFVWGFPHSSLDKESTCNAGDPGSIPGLGRSTGEGMEKSRILALESEGTIKGMIPVSPDSFFFPYLEKY